MFKIPPLKANEGHRAGDWGDLGNPLWKGRLRIIERSNGVSLQFEDATTGELFATATYDPDRPSVEAVLDSSRYFVIRVEDAGRKAYIGMGFLERSESFDFNVALQDYAKRFRAKQNPPKPDQTTVLSSVPKKDYSLKEGQTFSIKIPGRSAGDKPSNLLSSNSGGNAQSGGGFPLLPPPPSIKRQ